MWLYNIQSSATCAVRPGFFREFSLVFIYKIFDICTWTTVWMAIKASTFQIALQFHTELKISITSLSTKINFHLAFAVYVKKSTSLEFKREFFDTVITVLYHNYWQFLFICWFYFSYNIGSNYFNNNIY